MNIWKLMNIYEIKFMNIHRLFSKLKYFTLPEKHFQVSQQSLKQSLLASCLGLQLKSYS